MEPFPDACYGVYATTLFHTGKQYVLTDVALKLCFAGVKEIIVT